MKSSRSSLQSDRVTVHSKVSPRLVVSWRGVPGFRIDGTLISLVNRTELLSMTLGGSFADLMVSVGILTFTSTSIDMALSRVQWQEPARRCHAESVAHPRPFRARARKRAND